MWIYSLAKHKTSRRIRAFTPGKGSRLMRPQAPATLARQEARPYTVTYTGRVADASLSCPNATCIAATRAAPRRTQVLGNIAFLHPRSRGALRCGGCSSSRGE